MAGYSRNLWRSLSAGLTVKGIFRSLGDYNAFAVGADGGVAFRFETPHIGQAPKPPTHGQLEKEYLREKAREEEVKIESLDQATYFRYVADFIGIGAFLAFLNVVIKIQDGIYITTVFFILFPISLLPTSLYLLFSINKNIKKFVEELKEKDILKVQVILLMLQNYIFPLCGLITSLCIVKTPNKNSYTMTG